MGWTSEKTLIHTHLKDDFARFFEKPLSNENLINKTLDRKSFLPLIFKPLSS